jgi:phytoene dehydrogenase-like protein
MSRSTALIRRCGMTTKLSSDVVVVGAGLAGLTAAAYLAANGHTVTVLERSVRPGGHAVTDERNGYRFNRGPHALYLGGAAAAALTELGVAFPGAAPATGGRILIDGELHRTPEGPLSLLATRAFGTRDKVELGRVLASLPRVRPEALAETTAAEWIDATVHRPRPRQLLGALVRLATYSHVPETLSADVAVNQIQLALGAGVRYIHGGWQQMVDQLAARPGIEIVTSHSRTGDELPDTRVVIVAVGNARDAGRLLGRSFDVGPAAEVSVQDLGLSQAPPHGFVLGGDVPFYLSDHSAASGLAPDGGHSVTAMQYLGAAGGPDAEPDAAALATWIDMAGIDPTTVTERRRLHRMAAATAVPTAARGGMAGRPAVDATGHDGVFVAGDWVGPTGHLADATVASARAAAMLAIRHLERRPRVVAT